jgi:signal transduction histidine kinase/CheY-like chemotaxis protein
LLGELSGLTASGKPLALEVSVSCERLPVGKVTTVFARDLTARKAMEAQLRQSQKMQAVGTMAGGIAHDFNNILGAILGNVDLATQDVGPNSLAHISLNEIQKAGWRARTLVRQILTFSRNESPRRLPVDLAEVVQETTRLFRVTLPPSVELQVQVDPATPTVLADPIQVEQALLNLCTNAVHAIGIEHGIVRIELGQAELDAAQSEALGLEQGRYVTVKVRDTGSGMDPGTLQRVFEPFFTTKPVGQGTGLGLSVVHGVMHSHLGTVNVRSTPGTGSTFTLYFPLSGEPAESVSRPAPLRSNLVDGAGKHVMYVDDDQALVFLVERALGRRGFQVSTYTDPRQALAVLRERPYDFDLLVTDYNMPGYSGVELLREVHLIRPDLPVALASGYVTTEIEQEALAAGARALIHKPNDVGELCDIVQSLVQNHAAI